MLGAALVCLASALASGATDDPAVSKFSVRNLSGGFIGLWWIDHRGRQLVAQSAVAVRHTSSVEINSFRGHRFVIRRLRRKARLADVPYEPRATDAVLEVGPTNDLVVVDGDLRLTVHNARYRRARGVAGALRARDPVEALRGAVAGGAPRGRRSGRCGSARSRTCGASAATARGAGAAAGRLALRGAPPGPGAVRRLVAGPARRAARGGGARGAAGGVGRGPRRHLRVARGPGGGRPARPCAGTATRARRWAAVGECAANPTTCRELRAELRALGGPRPRGDGRRRAAGPAPRRVGRVRRRPRRRRARATSRRRRPSSTGSRGSTTRSATARARRTRPTGRTRSRRLWGRRPRLDLDRPLRVATLAAPSAAAAIYHVEGFAAAAECRDAVADARAHGAGDRERGGEQGREVHVAARARGEPRARPGEARLGAHQLWRRAFALANASRTTTWTARPARSRSP